MFKTVTHVLFRPTRLMVYGQKNLIRRNLRNTRTQVPLVSGKKINLNNSKDGKSKNDEIELEDNKGKKFETNSSKINLNVKNVKIPNPGKKFAGHEESPLVRDTNLGLEYIKFKLNDPQLSHLVLAAKSRKHRDKNHQIILEGRRLICDALEAKCQLKYLLFSDKEQLSLIKDELQPHLKGAKLIRVPPQDLRVWSGLTTFPGLLAIFTRPDNEGLANFQRVTPALPITVICDNIREPNNLGSIIRSCAAVPCSEVIILKGSCDPWDSKALRGGCGGQFRIKIRYGLAWNDLNEKLPENYQFFIAENNIKRANKLPGHPIEVYSNLQLTENHSVLVIGGETHGISEEAYEYFASCGKEGSCLHIPLAEGVESLNTASAVTLILFEMRKNLTQSSIEKTDSVQTVQ